MESGLVVLWGKTPKETPAAFHMYQNTPDGLIKTREIKGLCEHDDVNLLPVGVKNKELMAVSCWSCRMIRLLDTETEEVTVAYHNQQYHPAYMCHGEGDVMYVWNNGMSSVLELNTGHVPFTGLNNTIPSGMERYYSMCYIPSPHKLLVFTWWQDSLIRAVRAETGEKVWEVNGEVDGKMCDPNGIMFSPTTSGSVSR